MERRPPHPVPDIEALLVVVEALDGFQIELRQERRVYAVVRYRSGEPVGASMWIDSRPRHRGASAERLEDFVDSCLNSHHDELHIPPASTHDGSPPDRTAEEE
jgi:hypothetical protein